MRKMQSDTRRRIIDITEKLIAEHGGSEVRITDVAKGASVGIQTIYYYFESRSHLVAEAQMTTYFRLIEPLHDLLKSAEVALSERDENRFWELIGDSLMLSWSYGKGVDRWIISKILIDIWADPRTRREFCEILDVQFERWVNVTRITKSLGWVDEATNTDALITTYWAISIGQGIFANTAKIDCSPEDIRDFFLSNARSKRPRQ